MDEIIPPDKPIPLSLRKVKDPSNREHIAAIVAKTHLPTHVVEGIMGDIVMAPHTRESQGQIASRWGVGFGQISACRQMGKILIEDARASMTTKSLILSNKAMDSLMDDLSDPDKLSELRTKDKLAIAKQMTDNALNLENKAVGGVTQTNVDVGAVQILIQQREEKAKQGGSDAMARLLAAGLDPKHAES